MGAKITIKNSGDEDVVLRHANLEETKMIPLSPGDSADVDLGTEEDRITVKAMLPQVAEISEPSQPAILTTPDPTDPTSMNPHAFNTVQNPENGVYLFGWGNTVQGIVDYAEATNTFYGTGATPDEANDDYRLKTHGTPLPGTPERDALDAENAAKPSVDPIPEGEPGPVTDEETNAMLGTGGSVGQGSTGGDSSDATENAGSPQPSTGEPAAPAGEPVSAGGEAKQPEPAAARTVDDLNSFHDQYADKEEQWVYGVGETYAGIREGTLPYGIGASQEDAQADYEAKKAAGGAA